MFLPGLIYAQIIFAGMSIVTLSFIVWLHTQCSLLRKHPNQLVLISIIFMLIHSIIYFAGLMMILLDNLGQFWIVNTLIFSSRLFMLYYLSVVDIEIALKLMNKGFVKYQNRVALYHIIITVYALIRTLAPLAIGGVDAMVHYQDSYQGSPPDIALNCICFTLLLSINTVPVAIVMYYIRSNWNKLFVRQILISTYTFVWFTFIFIAFLLNCAGQAEQADLSLTIAVILEMFMAFFVALVRLHHHEVKCTLKKVFSSNFRNKQLPLLCNQTQERNDEFAQLYSNLTIGAVVEMLTLLCSYFERHNESFSTSASSIRFTLSNQEFQKYSQRIMGIYKWTKPDAVELQEYCHCYFHELREKVNFNASEFVQSIDMMYIIPKLLEESKLDLGASGSLIIKTLDSKYILKTISKKECKFLVETVTQTLQEKQYQYNDKSLMAQILGIFHAKSTRQYFLVMDNIIQSKNVLSVYDLKGSILNRTSKDGKLLKDNDFLRNQMKINVSPEDKQTIMQSLEQDTNILKSLKIMDYSLLLAVVEDDSPPNKYEFFDKDNPRIKYCLGVIDYVQLFNKVKWLQSKWQNLGKKDQASSVCPLRYAERFLNFIDNSFS